MGSKKIILALLFISVSIKSFSQDFDIRQAVYARYNIAGNYKLADWYQDDFKQKVAYDIGYRFSILKMGINLSYQHYYGVSSPEILSNINAKRQFDLYANTYTFGLGYEINDKNKFNFTPFFNLNFGDPIRIHSKSVYVDGLESFGSENSNNGTYMGSGTLGLELGLLMKYKIGNKFAIECEIAKNWLNDSSNLLNDKSLYKAFSGNLDGYESGVSSKLSATKLMIGLSYTFYNNNN
jgi:hypothetical protein